MKILIQVLSDDDVVLAERESIDSWEAAEESFGKLERMFKNQVRTKADWDGEDPEIEQVEEKEELLKQEEDEHLKEN